MKTLAVAGLARLALGVAAVDVLVREEPEGVTELVDLGGAECDPHAIGLPSGRAVAPRAESRWDAVEDRWTGDVNGRSLHEHRDHEVAVPVAQGVVVDRLVRGADVEIEGITAFRGDVERVDTCPERLSERPTVGIVGGPPVVVLVHTVVVRHAVSSAPPSLL